MTNESTTIENYLEAVAGNLIARPRAALEELREHLLDAAESGELGEALQRLGHPRSAAASFVRADVLPAAPLPGRLLAAVIDNLPLVVLAVALLVQDVLRGAEHFVATFPPHVYLQIGGFAAAPFPFTEVGAYAGGWLYGLGMPLALAWSIFGLAWIECRWGAGPGKWLLGLRLVSEEGLRVPGHAAVLRRLSFIAGPIAWADWIPALWGERQRLLDRVARTKVVALDSETPKP